jgi:membrane protein YqaA with SNARE-associated domain
MCPGHRWRQMRLLLSTFGICVVSALFPVVNAEAYLGALATMGDGSHLWGVAVAAGLGQTCGKLVFFHVGRSSLSWGWVRRKIDSPRWQARVARWQRRTHDNPWAVTGLIGVSALLGLPPLAIVSVLAGQLRAPVAIFAVSVFVGRTLRFAAVFAGVSALDLT